MVRQNSLDTLTIINLDDLVNAFGWGSVPSLGSLARFIFRGAARKFARQMLEFDDEISYKGLATAACHTECLFARDVRVFNSELLPNEPFLALSNHPGLTDTLAVMAALGKPDLRIIALDRPFLISLPNLSRQLFFVTDQPHERVSLVRRVSKHLRDGGSILTFPAGSNEPDPDVYSGALESIKNWTESVGVFVRLAPETALVPICVRSVISNTIAHNPLARLRRTQNDRQLLSSVLQLLSSIVFNFRPVTVKVQIGRPITVKILGSTATDVIHHAVLSEMRRLIEDKPTGQGISLFHE